MAAASNALNFDTEDELHNEVLKRVTSSMIMQDTQDGERHTNAAGQSNTVHAFGYPFTGGSLLYGARVNYAAKDYWTPNPPDGYAVRRDAARNRTLRGLPRGQRQPSTAMPTTTRSTSRPPGRRTSSAPSRSFSCRSRRTSGP